MGLFKKSPEEKSNIFLYYELLKMKKNYEDAGRPVIKTPLYTCIQNFKDLTEDIKRDPVWWVYLEEETLSKEGRLAWAAVIQANEVLWSLDEIIDAPAFILVSGCKEFDYHPNYLKYQANSFADGKYKDNTNAHPAFKKVCEFVRKETTDVINNKFTLNIENKQWTSFITSLMLQRDRIPGQYITGEIMPVLHLPEKVNSTIMLPQEFWTEKFKEYYINGSSRYQFRR
ncbi:MAG: hypothetical protein LBM93_15470 [Oscillospiraceae bacterium]|jgi:hypothetical protein|nr:hypothetical protein [Oscillospiraceae bacterium]